MGGFLKMYIFHFFRREKNVIEDSRTQVNK